MVDEARLSYPGGMPAASLLLAFLTLAGSVSPPAAPLDDLSERLVALGSESSRERERAERWLGAHVTLADYSGLRETARGGDVEVRRRLARVLGGADRHLELAARFLGETDPELRRVGDQAVRALIAHWNSDLALAGIVDDELERALDLLGERDRAHLLRIDLTEPLAETVERLASHPSVPISLVVDPGLPTRANPAPGEESVVTVGPWWELVPLLARSHGVGVEGFGLPSERGALLRDGGMVRFTARAEIGAAPAVDFLVRWCAALAPNSPAASSRPRETILSLAATGWPAAIGLLEARWERDRDRAALDGLFRAAGRGRLAAGLTGTAELAELVAIAERGLDGGTPEGLARAHRFLRALGAAGCVSPRGEDLAAAILIGWREASARGRWLRLALLETLGCQAPPEAPARVVTRELLTARPSSRPSGAVPPRLLFQALRTWAVLVRAEPEPCVFGDPAALLAAPRNDEEERELVSLCRRTGLAPPSAWRDPAALPSELPGARAGSDPARERLLLFAWWFGFDEGVAADHLHALLTSAAPPATSIRHGEDAAEILERAGLRGERARVLEVLRLARGVAATDPVRIAVDRTALLAGALPAGRIPAVAEAALRPPPPPAVVSDLALLGAVAGLPAGGERADRARALLLERFTTLLTDDAAIDAPATRELLSALERALRGLYGGGMSAGDRAENLLLKLEARLREQRRRSLSAELRRREWPLPPRAHPRAPDADDRRLDPLSF